MAKLLDATGARPWSQLPDRGPEGCFGISEGHSASQTGSEGHEPSRSPHRRLPSNKQTKQNRTEIAFCGSYPPVGWKSRGAGRWQGFQLSRVHVKLNIVRKLSTGAICLINAMIVFVFRTSNETYYYAVQKRSGRCRAG